MSRFGRVGRRPDHWDSPHERARLRLAERMAGDLGVDEGAWLDEHLAGCAACTSVDAQYTADRLVLRSLRDVAPEPPRDLWARTASAIEQESGGRRSNREGSTRRAAAIPLGALSGIAVVALVVGVSALSSGIGPRAIPTAVSEEASDQISTTGGDGGSDPADALPTPFAVGVGAVQWVDKAANGTLAYNNADVDEVCPAEGTSGCPALEDTSQQRLDLRTAPRTIIESPTDGPTLAIADDGSGNDQIIVFDLPDATPTPVTNPTATPTPGPTGRSTISGSAVPSGGATSSAPAGQTPPPSAAVSSPATTSSPETSSPSPSVSPVVPSPSPSLSPTPAVAQNLAIASGIELVGESAAFSADGSWFAFTARPAGGSRGPDVYVWHVGDGSARALTTDGSTVFASWDGEQLVASRPAAVPPGENTASPVTIRIDPSTGAESPAGDVWRPIVDPTRRRAIGWTGTLARSADGTIWTPATGKLELRPWSGDGATHVPQGQQRDAIVVTDAAAAGFDVRWDEAGDWVAIWVADTADPNVGRLSLYQVDMTRGRLELPKDAPTGVAALPGFSIGKGRLAWATPPGQDGEGSRIQIVAWNDDGVGTIESAPGEDIVVIR